MKGKLLEEQQSLICWERAAMLKGNHMMETKHSSKSKIVCVTLEAQKDIQEVEHQSAVLSIMHGSRDENGAWAPLLQQYAVAAYSGALH